MLLLNLALLTGYAFYLVRKDTRATASFLVSAYIMYLVLSPFVPHEYYFTFNATRDVIFGIAVLMWNVERPISHRLNVVGLLSLLCLPVNIMGYFFYMAYLPATVYDICMIAIMLLQLCLLQGGALTDGSYFRKPNKSVILRFINGYSFKLFAKAKKS